MNRISPWSCGLTCSGGRRAVDTSGGSTEDQRLLLGVSGAVSSRAAGVTPAYEAVSRQTGQSEPDITRAGPKELGDVERGLLTSAVRCLAANGYHATTARDIAAWWS